MKADREDYIERKGPVIEAKISKEDIQEKIKREKEEEKQYKEKLLAEMKADRLEYNIKHAENDHIAASLIAKAQLDHQRDTQ